MEIKLSPKLSSILQYAREEAMRTGSYAIGADHLLLGILRDGDNDAVRTLEQMGVMCGELKAHIDSLIMRSRSVPWGDYDRMGVSREAGAAINMATLEALKAGVDEVSASHLLMAIVRAESGAGRDLLARRGVTAGALSSQMEKSGVLGSGARRVTPSPADISHIIRIPPDNNPKTFS